MNEYPLCPECGGPHIYFDGTTYVCPDCSSEFDVEALAASTAAQVCKDSNGTPLADGDAVTVIITRADVQARTLDFVLKDNGVYEPNMAKPAKTAAAPKADGEKSAEGRGRRSRKKKNEKRHEPMIADVDATPAERRKKTRGAHGTQGKRVQEGERAARTAAASVPAKPRTAAQRADGTRGQRPARAPQTGTERRNRGRSRFSDRYDDERGPRDYHRVKVTGLNSAVWPDPPGYRAQRPDTQTEEKPRRAPRPARRMNRKTEGGTGNAE